MGQSGACQCVKAEAPVLGARWGGCRVWGVTAAAVSLLATASSTSLTADASDLTPAAASCAADSTATLALDVINAAGADPVVVADAMAEAVAIFDRAGVALTWAPTSRPQPTDDGHRLVVILARGPFPAPESERANRLPHDTLGWVDFDAAGRPGNVIRLSFTDIAALARQGTQLNLRVSTLPEAVQAPLVSRAIGRVLAHELGHWFAGRGHTRAGLMSATFRERDLVDWWAPQLPREWLALGVARLRTTSPCTPAIARAVPAAEPR